MKPIGYDIAGRKILLERTIDGELLNLVESNDGVCYWDCTCGRLMGCRHIRAVTGAETRLDRLIYRLKRLIARCK